MKFSRRKRPEPEISMTSMVDVVLLLLFFFMVSSTFNQQTAIKIKLPQANGAEPEAVDTKRVLVIDANGNFFLEDTDGLPHAVLDRTAGTLQRALDRQSERPEQTPLIIQADGKAPHQSVMTALEAAAAVGFSRVSFAAEQPPERP